MFDLHLRFIACAIAGTILSALGIRALDLLVYGLQMWRSMTDMGWATIGAIAGTIGLGAMIVVPVAGLYTIINTVNRRQKTKRTGVAPGPEET